jgi:hypothetical protein
MVTWQESWGVVMGSRWVELRLGHCKEGSGRGEGMEQWGRLCRSGWVAELLDRWCWWRSESSGGREIGEFFFLPSREKMGAARAGGGGDGKSRAGNVDAPFPLPVAEADMWAPHTVRFGKRSGGAGKASLGGCIK